MQARMLSGEQTVTGSIEEAGLSLAGEVTSAGLEDPCEGRTRDMDAMMSGLSANVCVALTR